MSCDHKPTSENCEHVNVLINYWNISNSKTNYDSEESLGIPVLEISTTSQTGLRFAKKPKTSLKSHQDDLKRFSQDQTIWAAANSFYSSVLLLNDN